jgi:excinuclease ABC subunit B
MNLLTRKDTIVVASVSCIYNIGSPVEYRQFIFEFSPGLKITRNEIIERLVDLQYERSDFGFHRGTFRVRGETIDIYPAYQDEGFRLTVGNDTVVNVEVIDPVDGSIVEKNKPVTTFVLFPAKHYITDPDKNKDVFKTIKKDLKKRVDHFKSRGKEFEAHRIKQKVNYDLEMLQEVGYIKGIENYSRYFDGRRPGEAPYTLLDYFNHPYGKDWLVIVDESHITFPQIRGMYAGDLSRKDVLIEYGFRLPSAYDNRPLRFEEFMRRIPNFIATSATPAEWEMNMARESATSGKRLKVKGKSLNFAKVTNEKRGVKNTNTKGVVEQLLRPTGIPDPKVEIRPINGQVKDVIEEIIKRKDKGQRTLVTTLTKRMAEDLSEYLKEREMKAHYLHSDIKTLERTDILDDLRRGTYDCLIGVNLLREGLDLPEVTLVAILDADKEGFLRSEVSLIQTMGRAARHVEGEVILYADKITGSIDRALKEIDRRREYQLAMNEKYGIIPRSIEKPIRERLVEEDDMSYKEAFSKKDNIFFSLDNIDAESLTPMDRKKLVNKLRSEMKLAARDLNFELAAEIRDKVKEIE